MSSILGANVFWIHTEKDLLYIYIFFLFFSSINFLRYYYFPLSLLDKIPGINLVETKKLVLIMNFFGIEDYVPDIVLGFRKDT